MKAAEQLVHPFPPTWNEQSEILILGSFPSVKSREMAYFYGHPQNRFWRVVAALYEDDTPQTVEERHAFLLRHHIALWDVIASCTIVGSSDSSIRDAVPNDIRPILDRAPIRGIYTNGQTSFRLYRKYLLPELGKGIIAHRMPAPHELAHDLDRRVGVAEGRDAEPEDRHFFAPPKIWSK